MGPIWVPVLGLASIGRSLKAIGLNERTSSSRTDRSIDPVISDLTSDQVGIPPELKHINKAEEKKPTGIPSVTANEAGKAQV